MSRQDVAGDDPSTGFYRFFGPRGGTEMTDSGATALAMADEWERRDYDAFMDHFADGAAVRDVPRGATLTTTAEIREWAEAWVTASSDSKVTATARVSSSNGAVMEGTWAGTNDGPFGPMPATGRAVSVPFAIVITFDDAGKVTNYDLYYDMYTLLSQLGQVPALV
jgi:steroid delta-isomerase-like uncharacterized protein